MHVRRSRVVFEPRLVADIVAIDVQTTMVRSIVEIVRERVFHMKIRRQQVC